MNDDLDEAINKQTDETLAVTRNLRILAEETQASGAQSAVQLKEQGDQLRRVKQNQEQVDDSLNKADEELRLLDRCCCFFLCMKKKKPSTSEPSVTPPPEVSNTPKTSALPSNVSQARKAGNIEHITNDAREDEMDENVGVVIDAVGNIKNIALAMNKELADQNELLDDINVKAQDQEVHLKKSDMKVNKILKS